MKVIKNGIWIPKPKVKSSKRIKIPVERNPTNDFGGSKTKGTGIKSKPDSIHSL